MLNRFNIISHLNLMKTDLDLENGTPFVATKVGNYSILRLTKKYIMC